jgi:hypothetical protein
MTWTKQQQEALAREYARVGFRAGDQWPFPSEPALAPEEFLQLLRSIPVGAGLGGYLEALRRRSAGQPRALLTGRFGCTHWHRSASRRARAGDQP